MRSVFTTLIVVEIERKCTKPMFLSHTIFTWSMSSKRRPNLFSGISPTKFRISSTLTT